MARAGGETSFTVCEPARDMDGGFDLLSGADRLPVRVVNRRAAGWAAPALRLLVALLFPTFILLSEDGAAEDPDAAIVGIVFCGVLGLLSAVSLLRSLTLRTTWTFLPDRVEFVQEWLLRRRAWTEPLAAYRGIATERKTDGTGKRSVHALTLVHRHTDRRNLVLSAARSLAALRKRQAGYARLLNLPGLIETEQGLEGLDPDGIERSMPKRVVADKLPASFDPAPPPEGSRLKVAIEDDALVLRLPWALGVTGIVGTAILFLTGGLIGIVGFAPHRPTGLREMSVTFLAAGALAAVGLNAVTEELRVSPGRISKCWHLLWGARVGGLSVCAEDVTDVSIARKGPGIWRSRTVQAVTEIETVHFGGALSRDAKLWVRDCIIAVISK